MRTIEDIRKDIHEIYKQQPDQFRITRPVDMVKVERLMSELREVQKNGKTKIHFNVDMG